ncbi:stalk domain-containing protein [Brevibacillus sp. H7]|uniref:stalk domain-containing protein n=1 Tax=Brevibacillus sp. H7 TaxID=3349138 RepID=UPI00381041BF
MKKFVSASLIAALLVSGASGALAGNEHHKDRGKAEKTEVKVVVAAEPLSKAEAVLKDVRLKKELIGLRQELKQAKKDTAELKAKYEKLVAELEKLSEKQAALEVQLELLQRTYQKGERAPFKKLGLLFEAIGSTEIKAFVDGKLVVADVTPFVQGGRALVPVRAISSALKADVKWDAETRTVTITRGDQIITLYLDKKEATVNGKTISLDIAPVLKKGRVFLPLRFISEHLNADVDWQSEGKIVIIDDIQPPVEPDESEETDTETSTETSTDTTEQSETSSNQQ